MRFLEWPNLKNTYCHGVKSVCIYSPSVFDDDDAKKILNGFIDPTYTYSITDAKKGEVVRKGDLRTLVATVNNPKRYLVDTADDIMFCIRKSAKLKDIIDITKFDKDLEWISISNNGVVIKGNSLFQRSPCGCSLLRRGQRTRRCCYHEVGARWRFHHR